MSFLWILFSFVVLSVCWYGIGRCSAEMKWAKRMVGFYGELHEHTKAVDDVPSPEAIIAYLEKWTQPDAEKKMKETARGND